MGRLPLPIEDPNYHALFEAFAHDTTGELADGLLDSKVSKEKAHGLVTSYLFRFAMMFDRGGRFKTEGNYKPQLLFSSGLGQITAPTEDEFLHELAHNIVELAFNVEGRR